MNRVATGMRVVDVMGLNVGRVNKLLDCCYAVQGAQGRHHLTADSIFNVTEVEVSLVCNRDGLTKYACPLHTEERQSPEERPKSEAK